MKAKPQDWTDEMVDALITLKWGHPVTDAASVGRLMKEPALIFQQGSRLNRQPVSEQHPSTVFLTLSEVQSILNYIA